MAVVKRFALDGVTYDIEPTNIDAVPTEGSNNTVSSSGVKSYVDSNYVPLSATQAPVTGLTDILTPVNLLPNSDFSRSGGYADTLTWENGPSVGVSQYIALEWFFRNYGAQLTNITVTRSTNSIRFQATSSSSVIAAWAAAHPFTFEANKKYTMTGKMVGTAANGTMRIAVDGSPSIIYYSEDGMTAVIYFTTTQTRNVTFYIDAPGAGNIDVTCSDFSIYEGEFKNPPFTTSLDVKLGNQFLLSSYMDAARRLFNLTSIAGVGNQTWFRVLRLNKQDNILDCIGEFFLHSTASDNHRGKIHGSFVVHSVELASITIYSAHRLSASGVTLFGKMRIAKCTETDGSTGFYLEAYSNSSNNNYTYVSCCAKILDSWASVTLRQYNRQFNLGKIPSDVTETAISSEVSITYTED